MLTHPWWHVDHHAGFRWSFVLVRLSCRADAWLVGSCLVQHHCAALVIDRDQQGGHPLLRRAEPSRTKLLAATGRAVTTLFSHIDCDRRLGEQLSVMIEKL